MIDTKTVGMSIALLRRRQQLTQQGLAAALNVSHQAVSKWENGVALPDMQTMLGLSRLFGVSIEDILSGAPLAREAAAEAEDDEAPATPLEEDAAPGIAIQLDADPLHMNLLKQADDAAARALEQCEDAPEGGAPEAASADGGEPAQAEGPAGEPEGEEGAAMSFGEIVHIAPFVSREALEALLEGCEEKLEMDELSRIAPFLGKDALGRLLARRREAMDWDALCRLAPFLKKESLADILNRAEEAPDFAQLRRLAPFLSRDALAALLAKRLDEMDVETLISLAPFLSRASLGELLERLGQPIDRKQMVRLARFLPREQMDRLVYTSMGKEPPKPKRDDWRVDIDLTGALSDLGSTISDALHGAVREARDAIHSVTIDDVMDAVNSAMQDVSDGIRDVSDSLRKSRAGQAEPLRDPARERSMRIRNRIAEKAFSDGNWDWIEAHIDEVTGDTLKKILMSCAKAGHGELLAEHVDRVELNSAEACRLAQTTDDADVWEALLARMEPEHARRVIRHIAERDPEALDRFARFAGGEELLRAAVSAMRRGDDLAEMVEHMEDSQVLELVKIALAEGYSDMEALLEHVNEAAIPAAFEAVVEAGRMDLVGALAEAAEADALPAMALALARRGQWDAVCDVLEQSDDMDLNGLWPLALEQERGDVLEAIAAHANGDTLRQLALALGDRGAFDRLEPFLGELDDDTLEQLLEKAMERSDWAAIDRIDAELNG